MKSSTILASSLVAGAAVAQPHLRHQHQHQHKRDVQWFTDVVYETETVDITTTVWITEGEVPTATSAATSAVEVATTSSSAVVEATSSSAAAVVVPSSTAVAAPAPTSTQAASSVAAAAVFVPEAKTKTSSTSSVYVAPTTSSVYVAPTTSTAAAVQPTTSASSGSSSGSGSIGSILTSALNSGSACVGSECTGDLTFYDAGLGACGYNTDGSSVYGIALAWEFMGTSSNSNSYCNMTLSITYGGVTIPATVIDKCMGCKDRAIDLTDAAFDALGIDRDLGRVDGSWTFTGPATTDVITSANAASFL